MSEQLSINFSSITEEGDKPLEKRGEVEGENTEAVVYEALDYQLAKLLQTQNGQANTTLESCTLEISKHTREGQIFIPCSTNQQSELLGSNAGNAKKVVGKAGDYKPLIIDKGYLYLNRYFTYQQQLAKHIFARIKSIEQRDDSSNLWLKERLNFYYDSNKKDDINWQKLATKRALKYSFLILSGGPGTGKTTTISRILALLIEQHLYQKNTNKLRVLLTAPTGKAAIRMLDSLRNAQQKMNLSDAIIEQMPLQASTLHKLLGYQPNKVQFKHNANNPLNADVVIVDESSMIDIALMSKLIAAVPTQAKLILIGDKDQLSSVETGSVFADICAGLAQSKNLITLQKNWRFSKNSGIGQLSIAANQGDSQQLIRIFHDKEKPDCQLLPPEILDKNQLPNSLLTPWGNYFKVVNNPQSSIAEIFEAFNQYRVLCALRRGLNGSTIMSGRIETEIAKQGFLHTQSQEFRSQYAQNKSWYHGRPIMITQNSYSKSLFNGDTGIMLYRDNELKVYFPNARGGHEGKEHYKSFSPVRLPSHETTWAMTIHKSQGSEFNQVTLILPNKIMPFLTRQLIYTGVTRAKEQVNLVASEDVLRAGITAETVKATQLDDLIKS